MFIGISRRVRNAKKECLSFENKAIKKCREGVLQGVAKFHCPVPDHRYWAKRVIFTQHNSVSGSELKKSCFSTAVIESLHMMVVWNRNGPS